MDYFNDYNDIDPNDLRDKADHNGMIDLGKDDQGREIKAAFVSGIESRSSVGDLLAVRLEAAGIDAAEEIAARSMAHHMPMVIARIHQFVGPVSDKGVATMDGNFFLTIVAHTFNAQPLIDGDITIATAFYIEENVIIRHTGLYFSSEFREFLTMHAQKLTAMGLQVSDPRMVLPNDRRN